MCIRDSYLRSGIIKTSFVTANLTLLWKHPILKWIYKYKKRSSQSTSYVYSVDKSFYVIECTITWFPPWLWHGHSPTFLCKLSCVAGESTHRFENSFLICKYPLSFFLSKCVILRSLAVAIDNLVAWSKIVPRLKRLPLLEWTALDTLLLDTI